MAKTNFSGPITTGPIQVNTGTTVGVNVRDASFVLNKMSFPFDFNYFIVTTDADRLATAAANTAGTTTVTLVDATQNVPGITAIGGMEAASSITITSGSSDSGTNAVITGTDVLGNAQSETLALGTLESSVKTYKTVTSVVLDAGSAGTIAVGILEAGLTSWALRSMFNAEPLAQTSTTVNKNLANNIVIPAWSRITNINMIVTTAFDTAGFDCQLGANVAQASGATLNSHDLDYFAGSSTADLKAVGSHHIPVYWVQTTAQQNNCLNVSDDDASGYEIDKALILTAHTDDILSTGEATLSVEWLQKVNATN
jgi:hypothetical protein